MTSRGRVAGSRASSHSAAIRAFRRSKFSAPSSQPARHARHEIPHRRLIPRRFAIAATEVSVRQFQAFLHDAPDPGFFYLTRYSPDPEGPQIAISWCQAAAYCNWLSRREGPPECYEPNPSGKYAAGMKIKPDAPSLGGYRRPTEAEGESAGRAGAETSRDHGASGELLGRYAWSIATAQDHAWPCGSLLPNELGLFDMLGNVNEWCQDGQVIYRPDVRGQVTEPESTMNVLLDDTNPRLLRGGAFTSPPAFVRAVRRIAWYLAWMRGPETGFRPSRTYH